MRVAASRAAGALVVSAVVILGCSVGPGESPKESLIDAQRARSEGAAKTAPFYRDLVEALPNVHYRGNGRPPTPVSDAVVVGAVVDVEEGYSFGHQGGGEVDEQARRDFDDDDALWKTVHLVVRVHEMLAARDVSISDSVRVGYTVYGDESADEIAAGFKALGTIVLFLHRGSAVYRYDQSLFAVLDDGALIAPVDDSGKLSLPFVDPAEDEVLLASASTLEVLRERARDEVRVIDLVGNGGALTRGP